MQKKIRVLFPREAMSKLADILKKYALVESDEKLLKRLQKGSYSKETILITTIKDLLMEKISNHQFLDILHKELDISKEATKKLATDAGNNLIPILKKIPENQLEEYNQKRFELEEGLLKKQREVEWKKEKAERLAQIEKKDLIAQIERTDEAKKESFQIAKKELLKKIGVKANAPKPEPEAKPNLPYSKKIEIKSVEENAKQMTNEGKNITTKESAGLPQKDAVPQEPQKKPDAYQEPIE